MPKMTKGSRIVEVMGEVQITAYKNSGWKITEQIQAPDNNEALRAEATNLGIDFHPNISYEKLSERVNEFKANHGMLQ